MHTPKKVAGFPEGLPGNPATLRAKAREGPLALRPTFSGSLPFQDRAFCFCFRPLLPGQQQSDRVSRVFPGNPATLRAKAREGPLALRPTLSDGLPFSGP